jgi:hypothetical protein
MLDLLAALALASAPGPASGAATGPLAHPLKPGAATSELTDSHLPATPWWERITVTMSGDGQSRGCLYTSSTGQTSSDCTINASASDGSASGDPGAVEQSASGEVTRITFERRFTPGVTAAAAPVQTGDTVIGREVMALAIDGRGAVRSCKVVNQSGDMLVDYGCAEARAERFQASARRGAAAGLQGTMSVTIYAHAEHVA